MKITKFIHSCLLVEMPEPVSRTVLFDPGVMSAAELEKHDFEYLDDIVITHGHGDHFDLKAVKRLVTQFPDVRITAPPDVVVTLRDEGITASSTPAEGLVNLEAPHEQIRPVFDADPPAQCPVHYLDILTDPGDSHSFTETKEVLALPVQAPWGSEASAIALALKLKPKHVLPIHDWHWSVDARSGEYDRMEKIFAEQGITFHKLETGVPVVIETK
jgi:L-ascorbate metabolism protein UlaG (beta-lactamase superfamily)